jgi:hypothetical protein
MSLFPQPTEEEASRISRKKEGYHVCNMVLSALECRAEFAGRTDKSIGFSVNFPRESSTPYIKSENGELRILRPATLKVEDKARVAMWANTTHKQEILAARAGLTRSTFKEIFIDLSADTEWEILVNMVMDLYVAVKWELMKISELSEDSDNALSHSSHPGQV